MVSLIQFIIWTFLSIEAASDTIDISNLETFCIINSQDIHHLMHLHY